MKLYFYNEKGSTMVLSLVTMAFLTIIISGLMPLVNSQVLHSSMNNDTVEAQYAAEAGAKRTIVGIKNNRTDWTWSNGTTKNTFVDGTGKYYTTKISPPIDNNTSPKANTTYTITSDGYVGNAHKKVIFEITTFGTNGNNIPLYGGAYVESMYVKNNNSFNADIVCATSIPSSIIGNGSGKRLENQEDMHYPEYDYDKFKSNAILLPDVDGKSNTLNKSMYYYDGTLTIDKNNSNITATNPTVIFVKGDINITSNGLNLNGDIMLIATGSIITEKNHPNFSSTILLANKGISFKNGADINGIIITPGQLSFFNNGNFNGKVSLATTFNLIMDKYLSGSSDSGVSSITIHDWRNE